MVNVDIFLCGWFGGGKRALDVLHLIFNIKSTRSINNNKKNAATELNGSFIVVGGLPLRCVVVSKAIRPSSNIYYIVADDIHTLSL